MWGDVSVDKTLTAQTYRNELRTPEPTNKQTGVVAHICNPSPPVERQDAETGNFPETHSLPGLHSSRDCLKAGSKVKTDNQSGPLLPPYMLWYVCSHIHTVSTHRNTHVLNTKKEMNVKR